MGAVASACVKRDGDDDASSCWGMRSARGAGKRIRWQDEEERRASEERDNVLKFMDEDDNCMRAQMTRFFTVAELDELEAFRMLQSDEQGRASRSHTLVGDGNGPWGIASEKGGDDNAWDDIDATDYQVRGPDYLTDKRKEVSQEGLAELAVIDLFMSDKDVEFVSSCAAAGTVRRLRRDGEKRELIMLNFRLVPLHLVCVWAVHPSLRANEDAGSKLLARFLDDMENEERSKRLKVIPRILKGPWPIKKLVGENCPAILGKGIPITYCKQPGVLEISVSIAASSAAQRISKMMLRAGSAISIELALLMEGQEEDELPERVFGGFRIAHAQLTQVRTIDPDAEEDCSPAARPAGLPPK